MRIKIRHNRGNRRARHRSRQSNHDAVPLPPFQRGPAVAFVITQSCCNDASCVSVCPVNCIHPTPDEAPFATTEMLYVDADTCIDCGACADECPTDAIYADHELTEDQEPYQQLATEYYERYPIGPEWPTGRDHVNAPVDLGTLRVAIVGSGPSACYAALDLTSRARVEVSMFDRLPTPYGLVRSGVAPDHTSTKAVGDLFRRALGHKNTECHFGVEIGTDLTHAELLANHHAVIYAVGAAGDRRAGIEGEDLPGSHAATEFVAWYNGHPDYADRVFDLSGERAVIIGHGNVALDIARILVTDPKHLARSEIAEHAVAALRGSAIREVVIVGRRGAVQAAFTTPELMALGNLDGVDIVVEDNELALDPSTQAAHDDPDTEPRIRWKVGQLEKFAQQPVTPGNKRIVLRFLSSPIELTGNGKVEAITLERTALMTVDGRAVASGTGVLETLETGLVLRSIGYRGKSIPDLPFDDRRGTIPNDGGRVVDPATGNPVTGVYTAGWIKRGPSGVIGTNRLCSEQTVDGLIEDFVAGRLMPPVGGREKLAALVAERAPQYVDYEGWQRIDERERAAGRTDGRPRTKFVTTADLLRASIPPA
ncbi:4Fe-4S binding protein [Rhodococcus wratislaviensis]|nr:4Fe-4S binding protein [Rhodococcus sp. 3A]MBC2894834.1 4Fe-4S binding protein [Rhodococcus sp. 4CII]